MPTPDDIQKVPGHPRQSAGNNSTGEGTQAKVVCGLCQEGLQPRVFPSTAQRQDNEPAPTGSMVFSTSHAVGPAVDGVTRPRASTCRPSVRPKTQRPDAGKSHRKRLGITSGVVEDDRKAQAGWNHLRPRHRCTAARQVRKLPRLVREPARCDVQAPDPRRRDQADAQMARAESLEDEVGGGALKAAVRFQRSAVAMRLRQDVIGAAVRLGPGGKLFSSRASSNALDEDQTCQEPGQQQAAAAACSYCSAVREPSPRCSGQ